MNHQQIEQAAELLGAENVKAPNGGGWVHFNCPFWWDHESAVDSRPSFGFLICDEGVESPAHCWACNFSGSLANVIQALKFKKVELDYKALMALATAEWEGGSLPTLPDAHEGPTKLHVFPESWLATFPPVGQSGQALAYLATRKGGPVPPQVQAMLDLRWDGFRSRVCFPIRGADHKLYGFHGRATKSTEELKYYAYGYQGRRNPQVWLGEDTVDWDKPVVIAESVFDLARVKQVYRNVISPLKAGLNDHMLERIKPAFEIVTLFDPDKAGTIARQKVTKWAHYGSVKRMVTHVVLDDFDAGDHEASALADVLSKYVKPDPHII